MFLLYFVRRQRWCVWIPVLYIAEIAASAFQLRGMFPISGSGYYIALAAGTVPTLIPFAADRWLAGRIAGVASTLVFPCTWTVLDYLSSFGPYGSWGAAGYSQYGDLRLLQVLSVTGLWGVTFLMGWFAAVCNRVWDEGWNSNRSRASAYLCAATIAAVILLGGLRITVFPPSSPTVRIASLSEKKVGIKVDDAAWNRLFRHEATTADLAALRNWGAAVSEDLLARAQREAQGGAKIVFWAESNALIFKARFLRCFRRRPDLGARTRRATRVPRIDHPTRHGGTDSRRGNNTQFPFADPAEQDGNPSMVGRIESLPLPAGQSPQAAGENLGKQAGGWGGVREIV